MCILLTACTSGVNTPIETVPTTPISGAQLAVPDKAAVPEEGAQLIEPSEIETVTEPTTETISTTTPKTIPPPSIAKPKPELATAWEQISNTSANSIKLHTAYLNSAIILLSESRFEEAQTIAELVDADQLDATDRINYEFVTIRLLQTAGKHKKALRQLSKLLQNQLLDSNQQLRAIRLRVYSNAVLDLRIQLSTELIRLYSILPPGSEQIKTGHYLWKVLMRMSSDELGEAFQKAEDQIAKEWIVLALAHSLNSIQLDPYQHRQALENWKQNNPDHAALRLIDAGLATGDQMVSRIALTLPLTSNHKIPAQAFLSGFLAQYSADSNPAKAQIEVIDIGDEASKTTSYYYQAIESGADFVIGPLGINYVKEMIAYGDFIVPTLLLGDAGDAQIPDYVYQFALAPEQEGIDVANRAWLDGHRTALVLKSPQSWSVRAVSAFEHEWKRLGGMIIQSQEYTLNLNDYSDTVKQLLNIDASVKRQQEIKALYGGSLKFSPRRRHDIDFIFLSADSKHGRLIKPYIDFADANDLPVYSTSHVFDGQLNRIRDQDVGGVRFPDMDWIIDNSNRIQSLRTAYEQLEPNKTNFHRLYAMGVDTYNLISRLQILQNNADARFHGVTSLIRMGNNQRLLREPYWAVFIDGEPTLIPIALDPERKMDTEPVYIQPPVNLRRKPL